MPADNTDELFYWVDEDDTVLGSITRFEAHHSFKLHRSIGILLFNEKNEMLFQQRSLSKDVDPGLWSYAVGGHVQFGDSYEKTAKRELQEELGTEADLTFLTRVKFNTGKEYQMAGIFKGQISSRTGISIASDEIQAIEWTAVDSIPMFIQSHDCGNWTIQALKQTGFL